MNLLRITALLFLCTLTMSVSAQEKPDSAPAGASNFKIEHQPMSAKELPQPGKDMLLKFTLQNSREVTLRARAFVVNDGKSMEVPLAKSYLNEYDKPLYEFVLPAPIAEMSYQFIVYNQAGMPTLSSRYQTRRSCLPRLHVAQVNLGDQPDPNMEKQLAVLLRDSNLLEEDLDRFKGILELISQLKKEIGGQ